MQQLTAESRQFVLHLAADVLRRCLGQPEREMSFPDDPALRQNAGCFVSLHRRGNHRLRGCIGILDTSRPLLKVIPEAAASTLRDPRFQNDPVTLAEFPELELEVSILGPLQPAPSPLEFDPPNQGIYLTALGRAGCFLPQVARETGWTREQLLLHLCVDKMGLHPDAWRSPDARLQTFSAEVIGPAPLG